MLHRVALTCIFHLVMTNSPFHIQIIRESLSARQRTNSAYSLRAFGRDLGVEPSTLSQVLNGKRPLPLKDCDSVATKLKLKPLERMKFMESAFRKRALLDNIPLPVSTDRYLLDESHYRIIAEWEHYAVLTSCDLSEFTLTVENTVSLFGISKLRAEAVLQNLLNAGLIREAEGGGRFEKTHSAVRTTEDISSQALRDSHLETLDIGKKMLETIDVLERDYSCENFAFDPADLPELKAAIREFREKISILAKKGKRKSTVYQMAIQAYPLSKSAKKGK